MTSYLLFALLPLLARQWWQQNALTARDTWAASLSERQALVEKAPAVHRARCAAVLLGSNGTGYAQAFQDWLLFRNFFHEKLLSSPTEGVYVDIGTNGALEISNTAFFDLCLGWRGLCFEPQQQYHAEIRAQRSCKLVPHCVMGHAGTYSSSGSGGTFRVKTELAGTKAQQPQGDPATDTLRRPRQRRDGC